MEQEEVIKRIKELGEKILPEETSLWLYGSCARGDARPNSYYNCSYDEVPDMVQSNIVLTKRMIDTIFI